MSPSANSHVAVPTYEDMRLDELLSIMDAATTLRREREQASVVLDNDETRRLLREKLMKAAAASGEAVTEAEVEASVERYFDALHAYEPPERGLATLLAHLYIRRGRLFLLGAALLTWVGAVWYLFFSSFAPFSDSARELRRVRAAMEPIEVAHDELPALALEPSVDAQIESLWSRATELKDAGNVDELETVERELAELRTRLEDAFTLRIASQKSGVVREFSDETGERISGYYLIVEAIGPGGAPVRKRVIDSETGRETTAAQWAELVPKDVFDRVRADKDADGILDESLFAEKRRGYRDIEVRLAGSDGQPIQRLRQITNW